MKAFIDTNIFVYATYSSFPQFLKAKEFLKSCETRSNSWFLSWGVVYEYLRVVTHTQIFPQERMTFSLALENMLRFSSLSTVELLSETEDHAAFLKEISEELPRLTGNLLHDVHSVALMREQDIKTIITADSDFNRFKEIKVINPLLDL